jgi:hypothetical protein
MVNVILVVAINRKNTQLLAFCSSFSQEHDKSRLEPGSKGRRYDKEAVVKEAITDCFPSLLQQS